MICDNLLGDKLSSVSFLMLVYAIVKKVSINKLSKKYQSKNYYSSNLYFEI